MNNSLTVIILTKNEEKNIKSCIESIGSFAERIVVVDSFSTDRTKEIALSYANVDFYEQEWLGYANQFNFALKNCSIQSEWVLKLDADERLTPPVINELEEELNDKNIFGFRFRFKVRFLGKYLRHGGCYPFRKICLFRNGFAYMEQKEVDEHIVITKGIIKDLKNDCLHDNNNTISDFIIKHDKYSSLEMKDFFNSQEVVINAKNLDKKNKKKIKQKFSFYYKLPPFLRAKLFFFYRYYLKLGFLDGKAGKCFLFFQTYWYRFLVDAKIYEYVINNNYKKK